MECGGRTVIGTVFRSAEEVVRSTIRNWDGRRIQRNGKEAQASKRIRRDERYADERRRYRKRERERETEIEVECEQKLYVVADNLRRRHFVNWCGLAD